MELDFEWGEAQAKANNDEALLSMVFPIGMADGQVLLFVAYNGRSERIRIISARRAT